MASAPSWIYDWLEQLGLTGLTLPSLLTTIAVGLVLVVQFHFYVRNFGLLSLPPGPFPVPFLGNYLSILQYGFKNTHVLFEDLHKKYGPMYTFWTHGLRMKPVFSVNSPDIAKAVLTNKKVFRSRGSVGWESFIPYSLLVLPTNKVWAFHRKLVAPCFSEKFQQMYFTTFQEYVQKMIFSWKSKHSTPDAATSCSNTGTQETSFVLDAHEQFTALTLDVIGKCGFGREFNTREDPSCYFAHAGKILALEAVKRVYQPRWTWYLNRQRVRKFNEALKYYHDMVAQIRAQRQQDGNSNTDAPADMLSTMMRARDRETGKALSDAEIVDQITTFLLAGHETTANTLAWTIHLLSRNPQVQDKIRAEAARVYGDDPNATITYAQSKELLFTKMTICEALRLYPVLPRLMREADVNTKVCGYDIPKGARIRISLIQMHRSKEIWGADAEEFRPERFDSERYLSTLRAEHVPGQPFSYLPFGAGVRTCIGRRFALVEAVTALSNIIRHFSLLPADPNAVVEMKSDITMGPKDGLHIKFQPVL